VPQKEKFSLGALQKNMVAKQASTLTPIRPNREDDERSKSMLKIRERYNRSLIDDIKATMAIDGYSINGDQ
jgi:hypothetical protein